MSPKSADAAGCPALCRPAATKLRVAIVVPCYNEEPALHHLHGMLQKTQDMLGDRYDVHFLFVDDGSIDGTWKLLRELFGSWANCTLLRHEHNRGLTAAFLTGLHAATAPIVCCMDSDCTYDPRELANMIPLLADGVDVVTASPYHRRGLVRNVPGWRLALSKVSSFLYRRILHQKLATWTCCFRVYRKSALASLTVSTNGFQGIAEILARLDLRGACIVEYPATLDVRAFGESKMRVGRTIVGHLRLLSRLLCFRLLGRRA
jgi:glycosyltransferase involved in cell wall biosynthesis